jgi:formylglycine-generating enzyme required for sulfatase activity
VDAAGTLYVADTGNHTIRKITRSGVVSTIAGSAGVSGSINGTGSAARFNKPTALCVDGSGALCVVDQVNHVIRKVTAGGVVTTLAGTAGTPGSTDGTGTGARFNFPNDIVMDKSGSMYVADTRNHLIRKVSATGVVTTLAGTAGGAGSLDGLGKAAKFNRPSGLAVDATGNVFVADLFNDLVRKVTPGGLVSTYAGRVGEMGSTDGGTAVAQFSSPVDVAVDGEGNVFVADADNYTIRKISVDLSTTGKGPVYKLVNVQDPDSAEYDVVVTNAYGVAISMKVNLKVLDRKPNIITQPLGGTAFVGGSYSMSVVATGQPTLVYQWRKSGGNLAANDVSLNLSQLKLTDAGEYDVVVSNTLGVVTSTKANLKVVYPLPVITVQPIGNGTLTGGSVALSAEVIASGTVTYQWYKDGLPLPNASTLRLALGEMKPWLIGDYTLKVSNETGSVLSRAAALGMAGENPGIWKGLEAYYLMTGTSGTVPGLYAEYFSDTRLSSPAFTRLDPNIDFNWGSGAPSSKLGDAFSTRWSGTLTPPVSGLYTFYASSDDGVRVWINGQQIINDTTVHPVYEFQGTIQLVAGQSVPVKVEYVESGGVAVCRLSWSAPGLAKQIIPGSCFGADPVQAGIPVEDTSPFHIDGTARNGASFGPDRRKSRDLQLTLNLPHQPVPIPGTNVSFAKYETTVKQWKEFIAATGRSWTPPTFAQTDQHPVVNVSKSDAEAYCDWMSQRTGRVYRLPTTAEWAVVAGHESNPWGASEKPSSKDGNYSYVDDGWSYTAPVGSYQPNALGLYDIGGNVNEWMFDNVGVGWEWLGTMVARGASWKNLDFGVSWSWFGWGNVLSEGQSSTMIDDGTGFRVVVENLPNPRYEIITGSFTSFQAAASDAVRRGGHLVTITSDVERDDVERQLYRSKPSGWWPLTPLLGGVKKVANAGQDRTFEWITGEAFSFSDWMKGYWNGVVILAGTEQSQPPVQPESYLFYGSPRPATGQTGRWVEDSLAAGKTIDSYIIEYEGSNSLPVSGAANTYAIIPGIFGSFASAKADAEARRGHLATITSAEEFAEVKRQVGPNLAAGLFLGAYKDSATGSPNTGWKWVTGEPFSFANWRGGEPNNYDGMERFLEMYTDWTWNDLGEKWFKGNGPAGYLIEFESSKASDLGSLASGTAGVSLPDSPLLYKARTFSLWAKLDSYAFGQLLFHGDTRAGYDPVSIGVDASGRIGFGSNMPAPNAFSTLLPDPLQTGVWYHLAGTVDDSGGIASFYLNGKLVWSGKANPSLEFSLDPNQDAGWGIGNYSGVTQTMANTPFKGSIDDVRFYNRVLNSTEIGQLFQYEAPSRTPLITVQPLAGTVGVLGRFDLSVTAVGEDLQYQWRKNGVNISGGINTSFSISSVTLADEGVYDVVVSNGFGSEISTGALLTIPTALPPANPAPGPSPFDSVIYVSKAGNDSTGTGTYWSPYLTLGKAVSAAPSGYRILVGAGSYSERVEFGGKTLRIHSLSGPALTTIQGVPGRSTIVIDGKNSELRGFRVTGGTGDAYVNASKNERRGGALICTVDANITDCIFDKNGKGSSAAASVNYGGAICVAGGNLSVSNCLFVDNYAMGGAGASYADGGGGAVFVQDGSVTLDRCTVFRNGSSTENLGSQFALAAAANGKLIIRNSILFGNAGLAYGAVRGFGASVSISVEYSDVQGTLLANGAQTFVSVAGNLSVDPQFVETTKLEFALKAGSPAIDAGSPRAPLDPDGSRADMGWRFDRYGVETLLYVATGGNDSTGNGSQGKPYRSISKAIAAAPSGARILVGPGLYAERIDYSGKTLRIHSLMGPEMTTIRGTLGDATVTIDAGSSYSELKGFRVTGGQGRLLLADGQTSLYYGGGIYCGVTAFIADCIVTENGFGRGAMDSCAYGGGVSVRGAFVTLLNCLIYNNFSRMGGGAVCVFDGGIEMDRCTVSRNEIAVGGAQAGIGIGFGGRVELRNSIIWGNSGGAVGRISTSGTGNTEFFSEYSIIEGGLQGDEAELFRRGFGNLDRDPLFVDAARFIFIVSPQSPAKDAAAPGLPYDEDGTPADIGWRAGRYGSGVEIIVNKSGSDSAGNGTLAQPYLTISKAISVAPNGAWISVGPGTYTERVQITGKTLGIRSLTGPGTTTIQGTAGNAVVSIETSAENSRVQGFRITGGTGKPYPSSYGYDYYGGGVYCVASAVLSDCIIDGNGKGTPRLNSATFGGAIYSGGGKLSVLNCLITGNYAWASGGATLTESGTIEFDRCTVQGNDATTFVGQQGGLSVANGGRMIVKNSIVYGNTGSQLGAFGAPYNVNTSISVEYSDVQGTIDGGGTPNLVKGLGNIGADPLFVSVTTKDFSLKTGSPAIDAANPNAPKDVDGTRADMGWRQDRYYVGSAVRKAPDLAVNIAPGNGTRVLLPLDSPVVLISGTVTHDTGVDAVIFTRTLGGVSQSTVLDVMEKPAVLQGSKLVRVWEWRIELPFENFGRCDYSAYAVDQSNLKSIAVSGNFTVAQGARVTLVAPPVNAGTVTVAPAIPADTLVPLGTSLQIIATPKAGYLFRVLEVDVDGLPENDITRSNVTLTISADTTITPQFIVNPFPALVGSWSGLLEDGWTSGLVSVNMTRTGAFTLRVVSGRNSFSVSGIMDASGRARIAVPASFWPYSETKNASNTPNSTALNPLAATLNLVGGKLRFTWGNGDPASAAYGSADLDQAALATAVSKLPSRRYTAALWRSTGSSTAAYDRTAGFFTADLSTSATALAVGVAKVSDKVLRFSFSGNLVSNGTLGTAAASESWNDMTSGLCLNYYAVTSSTDLVVHGAFGLNASELRGPLSSRRIRTGALDPLADAAVQTLSANEMDFRINGFPYVAPKTGQAPLPFVSPGTLSFEVWCSSLSAGTLAWTNSRPVFQASPGAVSAAAGLALRTASVVPLITNGAFSGSIQTLATGSSTTVSNRSLSGVLLQGGTQAGVGLTSDGLPILIQRRGLANDSSAAMVFVAAGVLPSTSLMGAASVSSFYIGRTEVTWGEWKTVRSWALSNGYSDLANVGAGTGDNYPVTDVSWYDVVKWCNARSQKEGKTPVYSLNGVVYKTGQLEPDASVSANGYRLPTEVEWEWAARGGRQTHGYSYSGSNDLNLVGWNVDNSGGSTHEVGKKAANEIGIFDMSGNVWEWCESWYSRSEVSSRVLRGGAWGNCGPAYCTVAFRLAFKPEIRDSIYVGFRVACSAVQ